MIDLRFGDSIEQMKLIDDKSIDFYTEEQTPVKPLIRLTLPFAIILMILMLICSPILFIITGNWKYPLTKDNRILNWFRSLKLI